MIKVRNRTQHVDIPVKALTFPAGERHVKVEDIRLFVPGSRDVIEFRMYFTGSDDIVDLMMLNEIFRHQERILYISYCPFARQDRAVNEGEPHALRVFCNLVNSMGFKRVFVTDPHSDVVEALLPDVVIKRQHSVVYDFFKAGDFDYVIAPDAGATKKASKVAETLGCPMLQANKKRDLKTGEIIGYELLDKVDLAGKNVLVVDDIADGAGTFIALAKAISEQYGGEMPTAKLTLFVTHGIFSKGKEILAPYYDQVLCYNDMSEYR